MGKLTFIFNTNSRIPLYQQLYQYIKSEIQSGRISYDSRLPSKRKLSSYMKISQNTIQTAYDQLIEEGYVIPKNRKGYYVCKIEHIIKLEVQKDCILPDVKLNQPGIVCDFSYNAVDMKVFPFSIWRKIAKDVINEYDKELLMSGDSQGDMNLRASIAEYLHQSRGMNCSSAQIIINSGTEFMYQILIQLFDKDKIFGIENPGYEKLNLIFSSNNASFRAINIDRNGMIPEEIIKSGADILCITPAHQFPSGEIMPINRRAQILNWANEGSNRYIIEDDYDSEFKYSGKPIPALHGIDTNGKVIYMGTFSKSLSPALRVSYMVLPENLMKRYIENLSFIVCPVSVIEQKVLNKFIQGGHFESHLNKMRNIYRKKRELLIKNIYELNCGIEIIGADAGLHLLLRANNGMKEEELVFSALRKGLKVYGLSNYYSDKSNIDMDKTPAILIGFASLTEDEIRSAVKMLRIAWF